MKARADDTGIHLPARLAGSFDVLFDGEPAWSFTIERSGRFGKERVVRWPKAMRPWLDGQAQVSLRPAVDDGRSTTHELGTVAFGSGTGEIRFVDKRGIPVVIDKWGIVQRPFSSRGSNVTTELAERSREVIDAVRADCGLDAWIAFGTLLGAARTGHAIGHDSDADLLYLSEHTSPALINLEAYRIKRALERRGMKAVLKSGSFITVLFPGSDGAPIGIDIYACFYVDDLLHETATVRAPIPREAVLPLRTLEFEGLALPAPARPEALLEASYGPNWKVPDPSFRHQPGPEITDRFDGWFGNLMTHRRAWEMWWREHPELEPASPLVEQVLADHAGPVSVLELGAGNGSDAVRLAEAGHRVHAFDYARGSFRAARAHAREHDLPLKLGLANLYDERDAVTLATLQRRRPRPPRVVVARSLLDHLDPRAAGTFWRLVRVVARDGGRAYLEYDASDRRPGVRLPGGGPPQFAVSHEDVRTRLQVAGATIVAEETERPRGRKGAAADLRCRVVAEWS